MVLVIAQHDPPKPRADLTRTMMPPVLKLSLDRLQLRNHSLLRRHAPDVEGSAARELPTVMGEPEKGEGLRLSLATPLSVSDGEPPELDQTRLVRM